MARATEHIPAVVPVAQIRDSLSTQPFAAEQADSVRRADPDAWPFVVYCTADSLHAHPAYQRTTFLREGTPEEVFGQSSVLVPERPLFARQAPSLTDNAVFQGFVLLLAATYATLLYRNLDDVVMLFQRVARNDATREHLSDNSSRSGFSRFLNITTAIGLLFMGVITVKYGDAMIPGQLLAELPYAAVLGLSLMATLACLLVVSYQRAFLSLTGAITLALPFTKQLMLLRRTFFSLAVVVTSPVLLLFALCPRGQGDVWFTLIAIELIVTFILYLRESFNLFISQKVSILHWFLYLCTVEIFPISLVCLIAAR